MMIDGINKHIEALGRLERFSPKVEAFKREVASFLEWKNTPKGDAIRIKAPTEQETEYHFAVCIALGDMIGLPMPEVFDYADYVEQNCMESINGKAVVRITKM